MDIKNLTPEEKAELLNQLEADKTSEKRKRAENIKLLKELTDAEVIVLAPQLVGFAKKQTDIISKVFKAFEAVISLKTELYGVKEKQSSHTFTSRDGNASIVVGYNEIIAFDGTQGAGISKIKEVIASLSSGDENREILTDLLNTFMKADKNGNLNPTRVAELVSKKDKVKNPLFAEGVDIIVNAQFKTRTTQFVRGWQKVAGEDGKEIKLTFSITAA